MMKNCLLLLTTVLCFTISSCEYHCFEYTDHQVDFFNEHPEFMILSPQFETVTETYLIKPAHKSEGFILEQVFEQVQVRSSYDTHRIYDTQPVSVVDNAELNTIRDLTCYDFYATSDLQTTIVPAEYKTLIRYAVVEIGTGTDVPAEYATHSREQLISPGALVPRESAERGYERVHFRIPDNVGMQDYLQQQLGNLTDKCVEGESYRINN